MFDRSIAYESGGSFLPVEFTLPLSLAIAIPQQKFLREQEIDHSVVKG